MASQPLSSMDVLRAVEMISETEKSGISSDVVRMPERRQPVYRESAEDAGARFIRRMSVFLKHNTAMLAGIGVFVAAVFTARKYWR